MHTFITVSHMWNQTVNTTHVISLSFNLQTFMPALERTRFQGYKTNRTGFCTQTCLYYTIRHVCRTGNHQCGSGEGASLDKRQVTWRPFTPDNHKDIVAETSEVKDHLKYELTVFDICLLTCSSYIWCLEKSRVPVDVWKWRNLFLGCYWHSF